MRFLFLILQILVFWIVTAYKIWEFDKFSEIEEIFVFGKFQNFISF